MNRFLVLNEFNEWVIDGFALWLDTHQLGELDDPHPVHNLIPVDIFLIGLI